MVDDSVCSLEGKSGVDSEKARLASTMAAFEKLPRYVQSAWCDGVTRSMTRPRLQHYDLISPPISFLPLALHCIAVSQVVPAPPDISRQTPRQCVIAFAHLEVATISPDGPDCLACYHAVQRGKTRLTCHDFASIPRQPPPYRSCTDPTTPHHSKSPSARQAKRTLSAAHT